jgi:hypothetical protein
MDLLVGAEEVVGDVAAEAEAGVDITRMGSERGAGAACECEQGRAEATRKRAEPCVSYGTHATRVASVQGRIVLEPVASTLHLSSPVSDSVAVAGRRFAGPRRHSPDQYGRAEDFLSSAAGDVRKDA